jgi:acyl-CoA thioester hydrolase
MHDITIKPENVATRSKLRVRFCETDLMGIVHHSNYLAYFEAGRVEWLRRRGVTYVDWAARGVHLPVVEANVRYRAPAKFDDVIDIETRLVELRWASLRYEYRMWREAGGLLLAEGTTRLACITGEHTLQRFPDDVLASLMSAEIAPHGDTLG